MSNANAELVTEMCRALTTGSMDNVIAFLAEDVFYHNLPYDPIVGKAAVKEFLGPFVDTPHGGVDKIEFHHTLADGNTVMNDRDETWRMKDTTVVLPVAGVFEVKDGLISRWLDYWDTATLQPILDRLASAD
jgi:limonene-1,2-epoxide hydrolase